MYPTEAEEQATEAASRRADIPGEMEKELIKKQAVAYPYHYLYPGFTMAHGVNPYYHYTPLNYVRHAFMTSVYFRKSTRIKFWVIHEGYARNNPIDVVLQSYYNPVFLKEWTTPFPNSI